MPKLPIMMMYAMLSKITDLVLHTRRHIALSNVLIVDGELREHLGFFQVNEDSVVEITAPVICIAHSASILPVKHYCGFSSYPFFHFLCWFNLFCLVL